MRDEDRDWMAYVDGEVRAACEEKGWGHQVRRAWAARETPVADSPAEDYEWKLLPHASGRLPDASPGDFEGVYYVLGLDRPGGRFVLRHDTTHAGGPGPHREVATYTEIHFGLAAYRGVAAPGLPPAGWLCDHLLRLTSRFGPNRFSLT